MTRQPGLDADGADPSLKDFLLAVSNEREDKYQERFRFFDEALIRAEKAVGVAMLAAEKATNKAEAAMEKRLEGMNEFRQQMADMQSTLARKAEVDIRFDSLNAKLDLAVKQIDLSRGRSTGISAVMAVLLVLVPVVISVVIYFVSKSAAS